jgi:hypothetical protein
LVLSSAYTSAATVFSGFTALASGSAGTLTRTFPGDAQSRHAVIGPPDAPLAPRV